MLRLRAQTLIEYVILVALVVVLVSAAGIILSGVLGGIINTKINAINA